MSRGLIRRIFDGLLALGAIEKGDLVVDPFGGIGSTGIEGAYRGVHVICCELEPKFVMFTQMNFAWHAQQWAVLGYPIPEVVQGDSRRLREAIGPALAAAVVSSPPYSEGLGHGGGSSSIPHDTRGTAQAMLDGYGSTPGQLGELPEGGIDAVISSPPYAEIASGAGGLNSKPPKHEGQQGGRSASSPSQDTDQRYGDSDGQLAKLAPGEVDAVIASPPYADQAIEKNSRSIDLLKQYETYRAAGGGSSFEAFCATQEKHSHGYGCSDGQLGAMKGGEGVDAIVASPPFLDARSDTTPSVKGRTPTEHDPEAMGTKGGNLSTMRTGDVDAVIASPPYAGDSGKSDRTGAERAERDAERGNRQGLGCFKTSESYGDTPGQLGRMNAGQVDAVVSSPPFPQPYTGGGGINVKGYGADGADKVGDRTYQGRGAERSEGNLETMDPGAVDTVVGSPPWGGKDGAEGGFRAGKFSNPEDALKAGRGHGASDKARLRQLERDEQETYGDTPGNLAQMPIGDADAVVSSPPHEGSLSASPDGIDWAKAKREIGQGGGHQAPGASATAAYPPNPDNIGNRTGETFWTAAQQIVRECFAILKPGGVAVWVVKRFVRDGQIQPFDDDWRRLCEHAGFTTIQEVHASLVHREEHDGLFGTIVKTKARKSFFRRLYESKHPENAIDYETVLFMRKPL